MEVPWTTKATFPTYHNSREPGSGANAVMFTFAECYMLHTPV